MQDRTRVVANVSVRNLIMLCVMSAPAIALGQRHEFMNDDDIKNRVEHEITETEAADMNVRVQVRNRVVTLIGTVPSLWAKDTIIDEIRDIEDVDSVVSELTIAGVESDRAIAEEVARGSSHSRVGCRLRTMPTISQM